MHISRCFTDSFTECKSKIDIVFLLFVLHFTLIIGNVEVNPGPLTNEISNTSLVNTDKSLAIYNINIRSIRNKLEFFQNFVDEFDIITVTETHLNSNVSDDDILSLNPFLLILCVATEMVPREVACWSMSETELVSLESETSRPH